MKRSLTTPRGELIIDNFAGGGGASTGIELALSRSPSVCPPMAAALVRANVPELAAKHSKLGHRGPKQLELRGGVK